MSKKTLVIDGNREHFTLEVDSGTLRVGMNSDQPEGIAKYLRITRVRCEIEIEDERESLPIEEAGVINPRSIRPGTPVQLRHSNISLHGQNPPPVAAPATVAAPSVHDSTPTAVPGGKLNKRLKVIDGADQGRTYRLAEAGTMTVGKSSKHVDIGLDDLYVSKTHCTLEISGDVVTVTHLEGPGGTHIDGHRIHQPQVIRPGAILRVGNSHLRLEYGAFADEPVANKSQYTNGGSESSSKLRAVSAPVEVEEDFNPDDPFAAMVGDILGHYELGRMVGRGFGGAVFMARHTNTDQAVAVKVLSPEFPASQAELERFARELKSIQNIRHEHLAAPIGAGRTHSHCWIAREYIDGESVHSVVKRVARGEKSNWTNAVRVGVHLAQALVCVHQHRMIHGNITPRNVLVRAADLMTKLTDLRFAECIRDSALQQATLESKLLAELPYLAPEQVEEGGFVDNLADLYAVGAVIYAMSAGRPPITGNSAEEMLEQLRGGKLTRLKAVNKRVPSEFDGAVMKLMALHQEDRFQNAAALLQELLLIAKEHGIQV